MASATSSNASSRGLPTFLSRASGAVLPPGDVLLLTWDERLCGPAQHAASEQPRTSLLSAALHELTQFVLPAEGSALDLRRPSAPPEQPWRSTAGALHAAAQHTSSALSPGLDVGQSLRYVVAEVDEAAAPSAAAAPGPLGGDLGCVGRPTGAHAETLFDAVLCVNVVQHLSFPEWLASEVQRSLRPGGVWLIVFSDDCFGDAMAGWRDRDGSQRMDLVCRLLEAAKFSSLRAASLRTSSSASASPEDQPPASTIGGSGVHGLRSFSRDPQDVLLTPALAASCGIAHHEGLVVRWEGVQPAGHLLPLAGDWPAAEHVGLWAVWGYAQVPQTCSAAEVARDFVPPGLRQLELWSASSAVSSATAMPVAAAAVAAAAAAAPAAAPPPLGPSPLTLERWTDAYEAMVSEARLIGIPGSAVPTLPSGRPASEQELRTVRDKLEGIIASFLSSGL